MMDTLGNLIDKQITVALKLHHTVDEDKIKNLEIQKDCLTKEINDTGKDVLQGMLNINDAMRPQHKTY